METEDNKENLNKDKSPPTLISETINELNNNNNNNNNISINIHLPKADRTESKLSLNSTTNKENNTTTIKSILTQDKSQQTNYNEIINNSTSQRIKLDLPLIRTAAVAGSKMMPIIKENASVTDLTFTSSDLNKQQTNNNNNNYNNKRKTAPPLLNKELKSAPSYFSGQPVTNGFLAMKVNPTVITDFAYLNRNKLVNRRLALRKQSTQSTRLKSISVLPDEYENARPFAEFALGNPNSLNNNNDNDNNKSDDENHKQHVDCLPVILTPDSSRLLDDTINVDSEMMIMQAAANSIENIPNQISNATNTDDLLKQANVSNQRTIKSSSIVVLEKNSPRNITKPEEPSPVSYHIPRRPPHQKNSPMYTIGKRCFNERSGGGRTSWEKEWFNSTNPFTIKSDFKRDSTWPTPTNYNLKSTIGVDSSHSLYYNYPSVKIHNNTPLSGRISHNNNNTDGQCSCHMILSREDLIELELRKSNTFITTSNPDVVANSNSTTTNANNKNLKKNYLDLDVEHSANFVSARAPQIRFQFRNNGTVLWPKVEKTPGPGAYDHNKFQTVARNRPKFSLSQARYNVNSNYNIGPFAIL